MGRRKPSPLAIPSTPSPRSWRFSWLVLPRGALFAVETALGDHSAADAANQKGRRLFPQYVIRPSSFPRDLIDKASRARKKEADKNSEEFSAVRG